MAAALEHPSALAAQATEAPAPRERLLAICALRDELDALEADAVRDAIAKGQTWSQVAEALGISKLSAHRRHAKRLSEPAPPRPRPAAPQERMVVTAQSRLAVRAGRAAARALGHAEVDSAHLLLGLMADTEGPAAACLAGIGVRFEDARDAVGALDLPSGERARIPISAAARDALEQSLREAQRLGHEHLGVEHLLLALLRDEEGGAVRALAAVGVSTDDLERCLGKVLKDASFSSR